MPQFNDPTTELSYLEKDDVLLSGSPSEYANIKAQNLFNRSLTRSALQTLITASSLNIGQKYTITNAVGSTLSLVVQAVAVNKLDEIAVDTTNGNNVSYDIDTDIATAIQQTQINGTGFVKASGTTISYDNSTYLTSISGINAGGELSGNYPNPNLVNSAVTGKVLTGLSITGSAIVSTDSMLTAFGKLQNQLNALVGGVNYRGTWNASTNTPSLAGGVGTQGYYYVVSVAGSTNLDGITDWQLGDWAIFNGTAWQKVDNTDAVVSVNGYTGIVTLSATDVGAVPTSAISGTSGYLPLFGASNTLGNSIVNQSGGNLFLDNGSRYIVLDTDNTGTGFLALQAGGGSASFGGSIVMYSNAHATKAGYVDISTSAVSGSKIRFTNGGLGTESELMSINFNGQIITASATNTGEHFIIGGTTRINGTTNTQPLLVTDGTQGLRIGAYAGGLGYGAIYVQSVTPNGSNFTLAGIDTRTILNAPLSGTTEIAVNGATKLNVSATEIITFGATDTGEAHIFGGSARVNGNTSIYGTARNLLLTGSSAYTEFALYNTTSNANYRNWSIATNAYNSGDLNFVVSTAQGGNPISGNYAVTFTKEGNVGIGTTSPAYRFNVQTEAVAGRLSTTNIDRTAQNLVVFTNPEYSTDASMGLILRVFPQSDSRQGAGIVASGGTNNGATDLHLMLSKSNDGGSTSTTYAGLSFDGQNGAATFSSSVTATKATFTALPTSASGLSAGDIWNDSGTLKIV